ncbi:MAG: virulence RhuM family protein [Firmicutes bacterium]|nr:virulence RhuM family protein [Bacillota bacterium]
MNDKNKEMKLLLYHTEESNVSVNAVIKDETLWITQKAMAEVFDCSSDNVGLHLKNIYAEAELDKSSTSEVFSVVQNEGNRQVTRKITFYNLDAIISVGYRVNSKHATAFRIWATKVLKEFMQKGFVLDDERMKQGEHAFGKDYFRELLERVRSIRASERRIWQQITDIFAECSIDYDKNSDITAEFYATVQNKFHFAITGKTAAEIVYSTADHTKENMGLTTWKNAPEGRILKSDTYIAKNYLTEGEIRSLERNVTAYFDYIEGLIERENAFTMSEFAESVNAFLSFNRYDILKDNGKVSHKQAKEKAGREYDIFNKTQKIESDFDKAVKAALANTHIQRGENND